MAGANLYGTNIEAVSELRTEQSILSRLRRSSPVIKGKQYREFDGAVLLYWQSAEQSEIRW